MLCVHTFFLSLFLSFALSLVFFVHVHIHPGPNWDTTILVLLFLFVWLFVIKKINAKNALFQIKLISRQHWCLHPTTSSSSSSSTTMCVWPHTLAKGFTFWYPKQCVLKITYQAELELF